MFCALQQQQKHGSCIQTMAVAINMCRDTLTYQSGDKQLQPPLSSPIEVYVGLHTAATTQNMWFFVPDKGLSGCQYSGSVQILSQTWAMTRI